MKRLGLHLGRNDKGSAKAQLGLSGIRITTSTHCEACVDTSASINTYEMSPAIFFKPKRNIIQTGYKTETTDKSISL